MRINWINRLNYYHKHYNIRW